MADGATAHRSVFTTAVGLWNTKRLKTMLRAFLYADKFTGRGLEKWNVKKVVNMREAFAQRNGRTEPFNPDLSAWDVRKVRSFQYCFSLACSFDRQLDGHWAATGEELGLESRSYFKMFKDCPGSIAGMLNDFRGTPRPI